MSSHIHLIIPTIPLGGSMVKEPRDREITRNTGNNFKPLRIDISPLPNQGIYPTLLLLIKICQSGNWNLSNDRFPGFSREGKEEEPPYPNPNPLNGEISVPERYGEVKDI